MDILLYLAASGLCIAAIASLAGQKTARKGGLKWARDVFKLWMWLWVLAQPQFTA